MGSIIEEDEAQEEDDKK